MENREAIELLKGVATYADTEYKKALTLAISALEKQGVDKCCETCKHKKRSVEESPCCDCYMSTAFDDSYEPYTEEEA